MRVRFDNLLKSDQIKIEILKMLSDGNVHTPSEISIKLRTNSKTVGSNSRFLELIDAIQVQEITTKRKVMYINITKEGMNLRQKIEKKLKKEDD